MLTKITNAFINFFCKRSKRLLLLWRSVRVWNELC